MKEAKITKKLLKIFIKDIRLQDKVELELCYRDSLEEFYQICLDGRYETYFLIDDKNRPLALGGAFDLRNKEQKVAKLWLLATNQIVNHKLAVYRYIKSKILYFKNSYDVLFNYIYKSNFDSLKLLQKNAFNVVDLENKEYKLFYFNKGEKDFDIRYFACK